MPYKLHLFDGLQLSDLDATGNLGTGLALTSFEQLPGGGFWDNYGRETSPQGIRPITLTGIINDALAADRITSLDDIREKIGKRGKLSIVLDDDTKRWQWARLIDVNTPRGVEHGSWFPFDMTWITAAQHWYGSTNSAWTWGDGSWTFGDGSTIFGAESESFTMALSSESQTITNDGNVRARNLSFEITSGTNAITSVLIYNGANANLLSWSGTLAANGDTLVINCGSKSCYQRNEATGKSITTAIAYGETIIFTLGSASSATAGTWVHVTGNGTGTYDGEYEVSSVAGGGTTVTCYANKDYVMTAATGGTLSTITDEYSNLTTSDRKHWFYLEPGDNIMAFTLSAALATVDVIYYNHYA